VRNAKPKCDRMNRRNPELAGAVSAHHRFRVCSRIFRSSSGEQSRHSANPDAPCHRMPPGCGHAPARVRDSRLRLQQRRRCHRAYASTSYGTARGPTSDISPRSTLISCGNSSRLERRRTCHRVIRGSFVSLNTAARRLPSSFALAPQSTAGHILVLAGIVIHEHGTKFQKGEGVPCSHPLLPKQNRPARS